MDDHGESTVKPEDAIRGVDLRDSCVGSECGATRSWRLTLREQNETGQQNDEAAPHMTRCSHTRVPLSLSLQQRLPKSNYALDPPAARVFGASN